MIYLACVAAVIGYYAWQRGRYAQSSTPSLARARAIADAAALALVLALLWLGGVQAARWGLVAGQGLAGATIGVILGVILMDPLRAAILRGAGYGRSPRG